LDALCTLLGKPDADWTFLQQRQGIMVVLECQKDILVIMATSSGKMMLILIPILLQPNKMTVVILLLNSLMDDYCR
jgi:superfamily II DNA helicase RecQ